MTLNEFITTLNEFITTLNEFITTLNELVRTLNEFIMTLNEFITTLNELVRTLNELKINHIVSLRESCLKRDLWQSQLDCFVAMLLAMTMLGRRCL